MVNGAVARSKLRRPLLADARFAGRSASGMRLTSATGIANTEKGLERIEDFRETHVMKDDQRSSNQVVGNVGLFYVCYRLSRLGWNAMPTARNARGIDVLIYSQDGKRTHTIQVKALSQRKPVPLGKKLDGLFGDFFIVCRNVALDTPECFVLTPKEVRELAHKGERNARISYWLQPKQYETRRFREKWDRIGKGAAKTIPGAGQSA
jgi:hypothetical protein